MTNGLGMSMSFKYGNLIFFQVRLLHYNCILESLFSTCCLQFSNGETPLAASEAGRAVRTTSLRLEIGRQYSDIGAYYNNGTDLPRQYLISRRYLRCLENVMKW